MEVPTERCQDTVPAAGAYSGVEQEAPVGHLGQACGDGNQMTDAGNESSGDGSHHAVVVEVSLALLHLFLIEQAEVADVAGLQKLFR